MHTATVQPPQPPGLTLAQYADAKQLDLERLRAFGLSDVIYQGQPAVRLAYLDEAGNEIAARFRLRLDKGEDDDRFRWKKGSKAIPYGQNRLADRPRARIRHPGRRRKRTVIPCGLTASQPSASPVSGCWKDDRDAPLLDGIADRLRRP